MQCSDCGCRLYVVMTAPRGVEVWRRYRCRACDTTTFSVERTETAWPRGLASGCAKLKVRPVSSRQITSTGADLAAIWGSVVPTQQVARD